MADSACGYNRQPIGSSWTQEMRDCEQNAWDNFTTICPTCPNPSCVAEKYVEYINARAQCLAECECGG